jgi:hypothetical protein
MNTLKTLALIACAAFAIDIVEGDDEPMYLSGSDFDVLVADKDT